MPRIIPILFMILLAGCGYHGCISQADVWNDVVRSVVYANPGKQVVGDVHWVKVDFPFVKGEDIELQVQHSGLNFCENAEVKGIKLEVSENAPLGHGNSKEFEVRFPTKLKKGDVVRFSLDPLREFVIDDGICRNTDEDVVVSDVDGCLKNHIGARHSVYFSSIIGAKKGFLNSWYEKVSGNGPPFITEAVTPYLVLTGGKRESDSVPSIQEERSEQGRCSATEKVNCLTFSNAEILECVNSLLEKEKKDLVSYEEKKAQMLSAIRAEIRKLRKPLVMVLDEYATNVHYKKLCNGKKTTYGECKGVHLFSGSGKKAPLQIPFVIPSDVMKRTVPSAQGIEEEKLPGFSASDLYEEFASTYAKFKDTKGTEEHSNVVSEDQYLSLEQDYEIIKENEGKAIKLTLKNVAFKKLAGSYSISVKRDCSKHVEDSLRYVFSESVPRDGEIGQKIPFHSNPTYVISTNASNSGDLYIGVKDNGDGFDNNVGYFEIQAKARKSPPAVFSYVAEWTQKQVKQGLYGNQEGQVESTVHRLYRSISTSSQFTNMVNALLVLYVLLSSLYFVLGFSKSSMFQLVCMIAKIIVVIYVLRPDSWTFFNDHLFNFFIDGPKFLIGAMTSGVGSSGDFAFMDGILYRFGVSQTWIQLLALLFSGPVGWISVILIFWGLIVLVQFLFQAIVIYLISIITIALLLSIAPYFLICVLFKRTKSIFDAWIKVLLQTAMQPVLIFSCIALLINAINNVIYAMLNFEVCDACVYNIDLKITTLCILSFPLPVGIIPMTVINDTVRELYNTGEPILLGLPGPVFNILIFVALANAARDFVLNSGEMCSIMFGAFTNLSEVGSTAAQSLLSTFGLDSSTGQMLEHHKRQSALFDRGSGAGRDQRSIMGPMVGGAPLDGGGSRRRPVIHPEDPPASF